LNGKNLLSFDGRFLFHRFHIQLCAELRYILDPKEVHGEDFPGETFRMLKDKEIKKYGEYRTSRLAEGGGVGWAGERMKGEL